MIYSRETNLKRDSLVTRGYDGDIGCTKEALINIKVLCFLDTTRTSLLNKLLPVISVVKDSFVKWGVIPVFCKDHMLDLFTGHAAVLIK